jgi:Zn-dependent protease with chaperone function
MIKALRKLQNLQEMMTTDGLDKSSTFNIGSKEVGGFMALFSSHPALDDRIKALENNYTI